MQKSLTTHTKTVFHDSGVYCFVLEELDQAHDNGVDLDTLREEIKKNLKL